MPSLAREKRLLQQTVGILGIAPFAAGLFGVLFGPALTNETPKRLRRQPFSFSLGIAAAPSA